MKTYYILVRDSHSAGKQYVIRFGGSGMPRVTPLMIQAKLFEDKEEVEYLLEDLIDHYSIIELTEKDVFEMRLKGK